MQSQFNLSCIHEHQRIGNRTIFFQLIRSHHLTSPTSEVLAIQTKEGLPGIVEECQDFLAKYEIYNLKQFSKLQFKHFVRKKISELNKDKLLVTARKKQYKKVKFDELETNDFKLKEYLRIFNIDDAKLRFRLKSQMVPGVKMNFQSDSKYTLDLWTCDSCRLPGQIGYRDTQQHIFHCSAYGRLRQGRNFEVDADLIDYFKQVLDLRAKNC